MAEQIPKQPDPYESKLELPKKMSLSDPERRHYSMVQQLFRALNSTPEESVYRKHLDWFYRDEMLGRETDYINSLRQKNSDGSKYSKFIIVDTTIAGVIDYTLKQSGEEVFGYIGYFKNPDCGVPGIITHAVSRISQELAAKNIIPRMEISRENQKSQKIAKSCGFEIVESNDNMAVWEKRDRDQR